MTTPLRGFEVGEYHARVSRAQSMMARAGTAAVLLTTEAEIRYFTGFLTRFWESPTRPWFLIVPASGPPVAVIPSIGAHLMGQSWIDDIRTWSSPDLVDDGIGLLAQTLRELNATTVGVPSGPETHLRMPLASLEHLKSRGITVRDDAGIMRALRMVKSKDEIAKITQAGAIAGRAFARVPEILTKGTPFDGLFRQFQMLCLDEGADNVPYLAGGFGPNGYADVISPATGVPVNSGDVVMLDTGLTFDGYFCDFDRNFAVGHANQAAKDGYKRLIEATQAGLEAAKPGQTASDLFTVMNKMLTGGTDAGTAGRLGHGLGMQLTEWPSLTAQDHTELTTGMVLTLEPGIEIAGGYGLVHEENIVITQDGAQMISPPAPPELQVI